MYILFLFFGLVFSQDYVEGEIIISDGASFTVEKVNKNVLDAVDEFNVDNTEKQAQPNFIYETQGESEELVIVEAVEAVEERKVNEEATEEKESFWKKFINFVFNIFKL